MPPNQIDKLDKFLDVETKEEFKTASTLVLEPISHPKDRAKAREKVIILFLKKFGPQLRDEVAEGTGMTKGTIVNRLAALVDNKKIQTAPQKSKKTSKGRPKIVYSVPKSHPIEFHENGVITKVIDPDN